MRLCCHLIKTMMVVMTVTVMLTMLMVMVMGMMTMPVVVNVVSLCFESKTQAGQRKCGKTSGDQTFGWHGRQIN